MHFMVVHADGSSENCTLISNVTGTPDSGVGTSLFTSNVQPYLPLNYTSFDNWNGTLLVCKLHEWDRAAFLLCNIALKYSIVTSVLKLLVFSIPQSGHIKENILGWKLYHQGVWSRD